MSVRIAEKVWPLALPMPEKLVALRLADRASDDGAGIWESVPSIAHRCGMSVRTAQGALSSLRHRGLIEMVEEADFARKRARVYRFKVEALNGPVIELNRCSSRTGAPNAPVQEPQGTGAAAAPQPVQEMHPQPSVRPTVNEPSGKTLSADASSEGVEAGASLSGAGTGGDEHKAETAEPVVGKPAGGESAKAETETAFTEFWASYPRRVAKGAARKAYAAAVKAGTTPAEILIGCRRYAEKVRRDGTEGRFIAHAKTWLNAERWTDEAEPKGRRGGHIAMADAAAELLAEMQGEAAEPQPEGFEHGGPVIDMEAVA